MGSESLAWYVLFENHTQGLVLDDLLRQAGLHATIVPTPRALNASCGMALELKPDEVAAVREVIAQKQASILKIASMAKDINPGRDRFC